MTLESPLPPVLQPFVTAGMISREQLEQLALRIKESPDKHWSKIVFEMKLLSSRHAACAILAQEMIDRGEITIEKFKVAMHDEITGMCKMEESLTVRGWWPQARDYPN
ncbi:MAG: hypothetical protein K2Y39_12660 [Candidatus Obscuribacterales bacterium]|nr:hypothetical protein [Candidatus Obscuribacterales bacterium]